MQYETENNASVLKASSIKVINAANSNKDSKVVNAYGAGELTFTKKVDGNLGDTSKKFNVKVMLTAPEAADKTYKTVSSIIGVSAANEPDSTQIASISPDDWSDGTVSKDFTVTNGTSISLKNIPAGVSVLVREDDYTSDGYSTKYSIGTSTSPVADSNLAQSIIGGSDIQLTITNTRSTTIDTGVFTSNAPYILILAAAAAGAVVFLLVKGKRRG